MENVAKLSRKDAAASVSSFLIAMVSGRILGSRLAREMKPQTLLRVASIIAISGFFLFWTSTNPTVCVIGLFFTGLGIANFYPQTMSLAISRARGLTNLATARISLSAGCSTLTAPLLLGIAAEREGILQAYGIIAALLVLSCLVIFLPFWSEPTHEKEAGQQEKSPEQEHESSKQSS
jgi:fucose permease